MINVIERFDMVWESAEYIKIPYIDHEGTPRNYFPDFIINKKYIVECKPSPLIDSNTIKIKTKAAISYCNDNNLIYKILEPNRISIDLLRRLYVNGDIKFIKRYEDRVKRFLDVNI